MQVTGERLLTQNSLPARRAELDGLAPSARGSRLWPWYLAFGLLVLLVAGGTWWLSTRQRGAPPPQLPAEEPGSIPLPPVSTQSAGGPAESAPDRSEAFQAVTAEPATSDTVTTPSGPSAVPRRVPPGRLRTNRSVFPADDPTYGDVPGTGPFPVSATPVNYGRVVQLGAFPTRDQAEAAWARITKRYPYLKTRSKMVNSVYIGSIGGGPATRMYRLQLGTSSQAQSVVICQQLEKAGQSCVVVY